MNHRIFPFLFLTCSFLFACKQDDHVISDYHLQKVAQFQEENKTKTSCEIVFLGDSLTDLYNVKDSYPQWDVLNRGIGGDRTYNVLDILPTSAYAVHPKAAVLQIGINDILAGRSLDKIEKDYEKILSNIKENLPECKLIVESLYPLCNDPAVRMKEVNQFNPKILALTKKYSYPYVDMYTPLLDPATKKLKESYTTEGLHLSEEGYRVITATLTPYLEEALA